MKHSLERTSPKGGPFIGTCTLCGKTDLPIGAATQDCENVRGLTQDEAVVEAITGVPAGIAVQPPGMDAEYFKEREARFRKELEHLINRHSRENGSDTPDFILAEFLADCLAAWDKNLTRREQWYGRRLDAPIA